KLGMFALRSLLGVKRSSGRLTIAICEYAPSSPLDAVTGCGAGTALALACLFAALAFLFERASDLVQFLEQWASDLRIFQIERLELFDHDGRDYQAGEPFVVGRHHVPRRLRRRSGLDHLLVGVHVLVPERPLLDVVHGELPALARLLQPIEEALALLFLGNAQMELHNARAVACQVLLDRIDRIK